LTLSSRSIKDNLPAIEGLRRSEVVHNICVGAILQLSELGQLGRGDLEGLDEVDPADHLHAARGGEGARVGAEGGVFHIGYEGRDLFQHDSYLFYKKVTNYRKC